MPSRNVKHYTTAIKACSMTGKYDEVLNLLEKMKEEKIRPDLMTYNNVSSSSSSSSSNNGGSGGYGGCNATSTSGIIPYGQYCYCCYYYYYYYYYYYSPSPPVLLLLLLANH